tara:strand:- start:95972 stop:97195 length:1224 start_codon:yes stop_codon:yes gene_type:complete
MKFKFSILAKTAVALLSILLVWKGIVPGFMHLNSDFPNYYLASKLFIAGESVAKFYDNAWFLNEANQIGIPFAKFTPFPPATVFMMLPFSGLSALVAKQVWTIFNIGLLLLLIRLVREITNWSAIYSALIVLVMGVNLINNFYLGQFYLVLTFLVFLAYYLSQKEQNIWAGILLTIGILFKYFPIVYVFGYFIKGNKKIVLSTIVAGVFLAFFTSWWVGFTTIELYFTNVLMPHLNGEIAGQASNAIAFQSFKSLYLNLFESAKVASGFTLVTYLIIVGMMSWIITLLPKREQSLNYILAVLGIGTLAILPASASYHYLLLLFPVVLFIYQYQKDNPGWSPFFVLAIFSGIGLFNIGFTKSLWTTDVILVKLLCFPRLELITLLFLYVFYMLFNLVQKGHLIAAQKE